MRKGIYLLLNIMIIFFCCNCNAEEPDSNANLLEINVSVGVLTPAFNENITTYTLTVEKSVKNVFIDAKCYDCSNISGIGNFKINNGTTSKKINVIAKDNETKKVYTIFITKKNSENNVKKNARLKSIKIKGYKLSPDFNSLNDTYTINTLNEKSLDIECIPYDKSSNIKITGNENLKNGENIINIKVENSKNNQIYTLYVYNNKKIKKVLNKEKKDNDNKLKDKYLKIIIFISFIIIISLSWYLIFRFKKFK